jgi:hypothetical protein
VPQRSQKNTSCALPLPPARRKELGGAGPAWTLLRSIQILVTKALPVRRWQSRQWQAWTMSGGAVSL